MRSRLTLGADGQHQERHTGEGSKERDQGAATSEELPSYTSGGLEEWRRAYKRLMADYAYVLGETAQLGRPRAGETPDDAKERRNESGMPTTAGAFYRPLLRLFVGTHVRKRLSELAARCTQLEAALISAENASRRNWLRQAREEVESSALSLPSVRLPGILAVVPFAAGLATLIAKVSTSGVPGWLWAALSAFGFSIATIAFRDAYMAFRNKRELFLPQASVLDRMSPEEQQTTTGQNVYRDEDYLFAQLGTGRRPEAQLDQLVTYLAIFFFAEFSIFLPVLLPKAPVAVSIAGVVVGFGALMANVVVSVRAPERIWK